MQKAFALRVDQGLIEWGPVNRRAILGSNHGYMIE